MRREVIFFSLFALAFSGTIYVSPASTSGTGTQANPFPNLKEAVNASTSGDTIMLLSGTYSGSNNSGIIIASKTLTFVGDDQNSVNISSRSTFTISNSSIVNFRFLTFFQCDTPITLADSNINFKDVTLLSNEGLYATVVVYTSGGSVTISNSWIEGNVGTVFLLNSGSSILIDNCTVLSNYAVGDTASVIGVSVSSATNITLSNSYFVNNFRVVTAFRGYLVSFNNNYFNNTQVITSAQTPAIIVCYQNTMVASSTNDKFCGYRPSLSCNGLTDQLAYPFDTCGVCGGSNEQLNCLGQCFRGIPANATCPKGKTWYVSNGGSGDLSGSSTNNSLPSISAGIAKAMSGDLVLLAPGVYNDTANSKMTITRDITIKGTCGPDKTILGGKWDSDPYLLQISYSSFNLKIQDVTITAYAYNGNVLINPLSAVTFDNVIFHKGYATSQAAAITTNGGSAIINNCQFEDNTAGGNGAAILVTSPVYYTGFIHVNNSRFIANAAVANGGAIYITRGSNAIITNSIFAQNTASSGGAIGVDINVRATISGNSFFNHTSTLRCSNAPLLFMGQNQFCGDVGSNTFTCINYTAPLTTTYNECQVCGNVPAVMDCAGVCWGNKISDDAGGCCDSCDMDCAGICFGNATLDRCGVCNGKNACLSTSQKSISGNSGTNSGTPTGSNSGNSTDDGDQISLQVESVESNLKWILIGAIIGGVVVIAAIVLVIVFVVKKRRAKDGYF
eukprot:TRINITY_DN2712_c0_g1_i1.p1 TRINITY_DN2712_c0_g1~~TRINITY_DN2712_c0_g1_i1.p1  ORF type:complete len:732 (-),score=158.16 TRINITY_DN2712_c0_g1_i1:48-2243(-)